MSQIGRLWAGKVYGTNTGNLFAELDNTESGFSGRLRLMDDRFGPVVYEVTGTFDGTSFEMTGTATQSEEGTETGTISAKAVLTSEGQLRGQWVSSLGTGGTFELFPHDIPLESHPVAGTQPEQLYTASRTVGALRIYRDDVRELTETLRKDFSQGQVVATYHEPGKSDPVAKYFPAFEENFARIGELRYLKLVLQEHEAHGINRLALIELNANGVNEVRVQGIQESWVLGKTEALVSQLRLRQKTFATTIRKHGLNLNGLLLLGAIVVLPDLSLARRAIFIAVVLSAIAVLVWSHARFIPNVLIFLSEKKPGIFYRAWPQIISWLLAASAALVGAVGYGVLKGEFPQLTNWLLSLLH